MVLSGEKSYLQENLAEEEEANFNPRKQEDLKSMHPVLDAEERH